MPTKLVAIWNCTMGQNWNTLGMDRKLVAFRGAFHQARQKAAVTWAVDPAHAPQCIFVAPEYAFADPHAGAAKPVEQTSTAAVEELLRTARDLTQEHQGVLAVPGTVAFREKVSNEYYRAWNASFACYRGAVLTRFEKRSGVGEVTPQETIGTPRLGFMSGLGYGTFTLNGRSYGLEICADATHGGTLPGQVDVHVVVGQGVGAAAIANKGTQYLIVADPGNFTVVDSTGANRHRRVGTEDSLEGTRIHYYTVVL
ncbi:MAG TPA: hypothetical protein VFQ76_13700 [Longimicrobiaceae bacterium]|nr:hypothetical protein [Longimicrobiaceae bacterium]